MIKTNDNSKGITLIALVITIVMLLILLSITSYYGTNQVQNSKKEIFKSELQAIQQEVNALYQASKTNDGTITISNVTYNIIENPENGYQTIGRSYTEISDYEGLFIEALEIEDVAEIDMNKYRYFNKALLEDLGLDRLEQEFLVNIEERKVISVEGFEFEGIMYYTLAQIDEEQNVEYQEPSDNTVTFDVSAKLVSTGLHIEVTNVKCSQYVEKHEIKYKLHNSKNWQTSNTDTFDVSTIQFIDIKVVDAKGNESKVTTIKNTEYATENYVYTDSAGEEATIPAGFGIVFENKEISDGLVISDENQNEYVWIPCVQRLTLNEEESVMTSIEKYNGFYISRYEAGVEDGTLSLISGWDSSTKLATNEKWTGWSGENIKVVSKKDATVWSYITEQKALELTESLYADSTYVSTTLPTATIWNTILTYLGKTAETSSTLWGNYASSAFNIDSENAKYSTDNGRTYNKLTESKKSSNTYLLTAGASNTNSLKSIYDLAGNVCEFTKTLSEEKYICLGGSYLDSGTTASINNSATVSTNFANSDLGFRIMLYIK